MPKAGTLDKNPSPPQPKPDIHIRILPPHPEIPKREVPQKPERAKTAPPPGDTQSANVPAPTFQRQPPTPIHPPQVLITRHIHHPAPLAPQIKSNSPHPKAILAQSTSQNPRPRSHEKPEICPGKIRDPCLTDFSASC